jgi:tRNA threonylcarbamoyladenosine biosynthesis protein TsaB
MIVLVVDSSGKNGSVALVRAGSSRRAVEVIEEVPLAGGTFSAQLVPQIAGLLSKHGLNKSEIDAFIAISGPGSFTGLRVGLAAIKALAETLRKPIVPVSLLEVIALAGGRAGKVLAVLDAGRGEVYAGKYEIGNEAATLVREQLLARDPLSEVASGCIVVTPDEDLAGVLRASGVSASTITPIRSAMIASVGLRKLDAGESVSPERLEANYIRRSDAEIFAKGDS